MTLDEAAAELYGLSPEEFTPRRNALAKEAKAAGDKDIAAAIGKLRKPSTAAWALNLTARSDGKAFDDVLALGTRLREAQRELEADELRRLMRERHEVVAAATGRVRAVAEELGKPLSESVAWEVDEALRATLADEGFAASIVGGRLVTTEPKDEPAVGFDLSVAPKKAKPAPAKPKTNKALEKAHAARRDAEARGAEVAARRKELERQAEEIAAQLRRVEAEERRTARELDAATDAVRRAQGRG